MRKDPHPKKEASEKTIRPSHRTEFIIFIQTNKNTQRSFDAYKIGTTVQNAPLFNAFENDCCFSGGLNRGFKNVKNGYYWQQHSPLMKWTGIKLWETVHPPLS